MDVLEWIQQWYLEQCDGDWEHGDGIKIETLDNPGWYVMVSLEGTELENQTFTEIEVNRSENDWIYCKVGYLEERYGLQFLGAGGPGNLEEILKAFKEGAGSL